MAGIIVVDNLEVQTDIGECQIQLCVGDITSLPKEDKVDVLVISAFPGDYSPTPTSLIGQLQRRLGVNVRKLAGDKEEDLRSLYSCWLSKPLSDHLSFGKILCFEGRYNKGTKNGQVVGDVFRCLVPILANKEGKVIMSLLSTGDQNFSKKKMLKLLVNAAIQWMKAGLQLRCLKIVLFARDVSKKDETHETLITLFLNLKETHEGKMKKQKSSVDVEIYDIYLSYSEEDKNCVVQVVDGLKKNRSDLRIFVTIQELNVEESWQEKLYTTITTSKRVVALLTPSYLSSARCTEQYNIALCHSRKIHQNMLLPLYISEVPYMPTYMKLTQYIDCRFDFVQKLSYACVTVVSCLTVTSNETAAQLQNSNSSSDVKVSSPDDYDVFLSYSHCNEDKAKEIMEELRNHNPKINIFIDTAQLKAGGAWQQALYDALDCSRYVIALVSNDYLRSKVCMEEFSLSLVLQQQNNTTVFPLIIEPLKENIEWLSLLSPVKCFEEEPGMNTNQPITDLCEKIVRELKEPPARKLNFAENEDIPPLISVTEEIRSRLFQSEDHFASFGDRSGDSMPTSVICDKTKSSNPDIYIISSPEDFEYCQLLTQFILSQNPSLVIKKFSDEGSSVRLTFLDEARVIIPLLSSNFMQSPELIHELNIAWCRQRTTPNLCFLAITVDQLPDKPTYIHLFPSFFNSEDKQWMETSANLKQQPAPSDFLNSCKCSRNSVICLMTAADLLNKWMEGQHCCVFGLHDMFMNYLHLSTCLQRSKETPLNHEEKGKTEIVESEKEEITQVATANSDLKCGDSENVSNSLEKSPTPANSGTDNRGDIFNKRIATKSEDNKNSNDVKPRPNAANNEEKRINKEYKESDEVNPPELNVVNNETNRNSNDVKQRPNAPNNEEKRINEEYKESDEINPPELNVLNKETNRNSNEVKPLVNTRKTSTTCLIF